MLERRKKQQLAKKQTENRLSIRFYCEEFFVAMLNLMRVSATIFY